jgi:hypothetical protein
MPSAAKSASASAVTLRRCRLGVGMGYTTRAITDDGRVVEAVNFVGFGQEAHLSPREAARLDALGALAPAGASREDCEREHEQRVEAYQALRRQMPVGS